MRKLLLHLCVILTCIISLLFCIFPIDDTALGYEMSWVLPITYALVYVSIFIPLSKNNNNFKVTSLFIIILSWIRCVFIPFGSSVTGVYNGVSYIYASVKSIQLSVFLVSYELIITSIFLFILINKNSKYLKLSSKLNNLTLSGNKVVYGFFLLFALLLYIFIGRNMNLLSFFAISLDSQTRIGDLQSTSLSLLTTIFKSSMIFLFVWVTSYCSEKYNKTNNAKYVLFSVIIGVINIGIIVGERRTSIVYTGLVILFILTTTFRKYRKKIMMIVLSTVFIVVLGMSVYKHFAAFYYGSYLAAVQSSKINLEWLTKTLQSYFFGTQNVAVAIDLKEYFDFNITNLLYDFGRSTFGLNFLIKGRSLMTSEIFNTFIYGRPTSSGHVISGVGYGYIYFGVLFSPIIVCLNIYLSIFLEKLFFRATSFEGKYIFGYVLVRFATNIYVNTPPLISLSTNFLFTTGLIYFVAKLLNTRRPMSTKLLQYKKDNKVGI